MKKNRKGFTLVEVLIAMGVFTIMIAIAIGGFVHTLHIQREIAAFIGVQDNASIALEQMTRKIRTGYTFCHDPGVTTPNAACTSVCAISSSPDGPIWTCSGTLDFSNGLGQIVDYTQTGNNTIARRVNGGAYADITSGDVAVKYLTFTLFGHLEGDSWNPRITISLGVAASSSDPVLANNVLNLQTTVSAREIDCTSGSPPSVNMRPA